jgi:hypothetical protein
MLRNGIPRAIVAGTGVILVLTSFVVAPGPDGGNAVTRFFAYADQNFSRWFNVLAVFAFILGAGSLLRSHGARILARRRDWPYSAVTLVSFLVVLGLGLAKTGGPPGLQGDVSDPRAALTHVYDTVLSPLVATTFSLLAFFVASAAYRAFRLRSQAATVLLVSAVLIMLGRTPLSGLLSGWVPEPLSFLRIGELSLWIMSVPNTAGQRAILIGVGLGLVSMSLRVILGLDRSAFGRGRP